MVFAYWIVAVSLLVLLLFPLHYLRPSLWIKSWKKISVKKVTHKLQQIVRKIDWVFIAVIVLFSAVGLFAINEYPYHWR
jgi:hypothetical protein